MATSINYSSTAQTGKNLSKSITDINPDLSNATIKTFTQKLNALTTNSLGAVNRVDKTEIDTSIVYHDLAISFVNFGDIAQADGTNLSISAAQLSPLTERVTFRVKIEISGHLGKRIKPLDWSVSYSADLSYAIFVYTDDVWGLSGEFCSGTDYSDLDPPPTGTVTISIPAGKATIGADTYYYNPATLTITITE